MAETIVIRENGKIKIKPDENAPGQLAKAARKRLKAARKDMADDALWAPLSNAQKIEAQREMLLLISRILLEK